MVHRRGTIFGATAASLIVLFATQAGAQEVVERGFALDKLEPSERGSDWFANESLDLRGHLRPAFGVVEEYSYRSMVVFGPDNRTIQSSVVRNQFVLHPGGNLVLFDRLRLSMSLPLQVGVDGRTGSVRPGGVRTVFPAPPDGGGVGDLRFGADVRLFGVYGSPVTMAVGMQAFAPTGSEAQYMSDGSTRLRPRLMVAGDVGLFTYAASAGVHWHARQEAIGRGAIGTEMNVTAAAGVRLLDRHVIIGPELWGSTVFDQAFEKKTAPIEVALGAHAFAFHQLRLGTFVGAGLTRSYGAPVVRYGFMVEWAPEPVVDSDGDGIPDPEDACPTTPGVRSANERENGCPPAKQATPPPDRDLDGVLDNVDACPDQRGVATSDPKTNGCPDTDGDSIPDAVDACPAAKGPPREDPALNGCPDTDGDGIVDKLDACPQEPGPDSPDPKKNGCPFKDRDNDGIPDDLDACPDEPGPADPDPKRTGCPKAFLEGGQIRILDQVKFKVNRATIEQDDETLAILDAVLAVLRAHPEIAKVRVEGHTDNTGPAAFNQKLSADRASAVVKWLVGRGIEAKRLKSKGFGAKRPIDSNDTEQGRQRNRRVELHVE